MERVLNWDRNSLDSLELMTVHMTKYTNLIRIQVRKFLGMKPNFDMQASLLRGTLNKRAWRAVDLYRKYGYNLMFAKRKINSTNMLHQYVCRFPISDLSLPTGDITRVLEPHRYNLILRKLNHRHMILKSIASIELPV